MKHGLLLMAFFLSLFPFSSAAQEQSFSDVSPGTEVFAAVEDLKERGIIQGRPDGTFGPNDAVNRAEAVTIVVRAVANVKNLPPLADCFPDVQGNGWYVQPVCYAKDLDWVGGYPDGTFQPVRTVLKVEYLKILLNAYGVDTDSASQFRLPLSYDVSDPNLWFFPFIAYALGSGMTSVNPYGELSPGVTLTRGQVALLTHRFLLYREGKHAQAILTNMERDIVTTIAHLDGLKITEAQFSSARVRLAAWGAGELLSNHSLVRAGSVIAGALESLGDAYALVKQENFDSALIHAQDAFKRASEADQFDSSVSKYTDQIRLIAHQLADSIRAYEN